MQVPDYPYTVSRDGTVTRIGTGHILKPSVNPQTGYLYVSLWKDNKGWTTSVHRLVAELYVPNPDNKPFVNHLNSDRTDPRAENLEWCTQSENLLHGYHQGYMSQEHRRKLLDHHYELAIDLIIDGATQSAVAAHFGISEGRFSVGLRKVLEGHPKQHQFKRVLRQQKSRRNSIASMDRRIAVEQYTKEGVYVATYLSMGDAAKAANTSSGNISNVLAKRTKSAGGYIWKSA